MICSRRHLLDIEEWSQNSGSNVIPRRARPGLAGLIYGTCNEVIKERIFIELMMSGRKLKSVKRGLEMNNLRALKDWTIHDAQLLIKETLVRRGVTLSKCYPSLCTQIGNRET